MQRYEMRDWLSPLVSIHMLSLNLVLKKLKNSQILSVRCKALLSKYFYSSAFREAIWEQFNLYGDCLKIYLQQLYRVKITASKHPSATPLKCKTLCSVLCRFLLCHLGSSDHLGHDCTRDLARGVLWCLEPGHWQRMLWMLCVVGGSSRDWTCLFSISKWVLDHIEIWGVCRPVVSLGLFACWALCTGGFPSFLP